MWRRFTIKVVAIIRGIAVAELRRPTAINCAEPANTKAEMAEDPDGLSPLVTAKAPKIMPNGVAPIISGKVARAPAQKADFFVEGEFFTKLI